LIQALADKTGGEAYQLLDINELENILSRVEIDTRQETVTSAPAPAPELAATPPQVSAQPEASTAEVVAGIPVQGMGQEERVRSIIIIVAAGILVITLGTLIILLIKRSRDYKRGLEISASEAWLNDINRYTSKSSYKLGKKATMLGRVAGKDAGHLDYVVIPESTIGRRHAVIEYKDYGYWIVDQGSINGTFVNDVRVNGDTRLKHGDRIRLHKFEFEFIMPDLEEAGVTRLSPATARESASGTEEVEAVKADMAADSFSLDLDFSGEAPEAETGDSARSDEEDDTLMPGYDTQAGERGDASEDETLMPGFDKASAGPGTPADTANSPGQQSDPGQDDETLMPGHFNESDDDA
ncbi:MAG: FHA domain-containing protein, partial [Gammaproteobacteria bacterium]